MTSTTMKTIRRVGLTNIHLPVKFVHGHLDDKSRLISDKKSERVDILDVDVLIDYKDNYVPTSQSLAGLFSYSDLYDKFCDCPFQETSQSLEYLLDEIIADTEVIAKQQGIELYSVKVVSRRVGLDVSQPVMVCKKNYNEKPEYEKELDIRTSGTVDFPFYTTIQHEWMPEEDQIQHMSVRFEALIIDFNVITLRKQLDANSLKGLFNYTSIVNYLYEQQGFQLKDCLESITDNLMEFILKECKRQEIDPILVECSLRRTGFPRAVPFIGIRKVVSY